MTLLSLASTMIVPAAGSVRTPVIRLPTAGRFSARVSLIPADVHASVAVSEPMVPLESPVSRNRTSDTVTSAVIPVASWTLFPAVETEMLV